MPSRSRSRRPRGLRRRLLELRDNPRRLALVVVGLVVVLAALSFTWESYRAVNALQDANDRADVLQENIVNGDVEAARRSLELLDDETSRAHHSTDGPIWWVGSQVPVLGRNVDAVRIAAREIDQVSDEVLPGIVDVADKVRLETFRPKNGRVNLAAVADAAPALVRADEVFSGADREIAAFDVEGLIGPLREPMRQLQEKFHRTAISASAAKDASKLLPTMLGADGEKRTYLLLILNNAEIRSLGGMPGSAAEITAKNGKVDMGRQGSATKVFPLKKPAIKLTKEERILYSGTVALDMRQTATVPDFPRAAELAAAVVGKRWNEKYDGVIAVDPVAMGYMLNGLGPIDIGSGVTLNSTNAAAALLNGIYTNFPESPAKQDAIFEHAARRVFDAMTGGRGNSVAVVRALVRGVSERRVMVWSRDEAEQRRIRGGGLSNALDKTSDRPQVDVYVNDVAGGKMEYFLAMGTRVRSQQCFDDDSQELRTTTTLSSDAPPDVSRHSISVTGLGSKVRPGHMLLALMVVGPHQGKILSMTVDGQRAPIGGELAGRPIAQVVRQLPPGQSSVIVTRMRTAAASWGDVQLRTTPGITPNDDAAGPSACAS